MTYSEASEIVQAHCDMPLLESLEHLHESQHPAPHPVNVAYYTLMAGFSEMFAPVEESA